MQILNSQQNLAEVKASLALSHLALRDIAQAEEKFSPSTEFKQQKEVVILVVELERLHSGRRTSFLQ
jgi:hypothetical protein